MHIHYYDHVSLNFKFLMSLLHVIHKNQTQNSTENYQ